jgi:hypothetical protein
MFTGPLLPLAGAGGSCESALETGYKKRYAQTRADTMTRRSNGRNVTALGSRGVVPVRASAGWFCNMRDPTNAFRALAA